MKKAVALIGKRLEVHQFALRLRDGSLHRLGREPFGVEVEILDNQVEKPDGVGVVVDGET